MTYPRAAAVAEIGWSRADRIDWSGFRQRLDAARRWYDAVDLHYADTEFRAARPLATNGLGMRHSQELQLCSDRLTLSLEDDAPVRGDRAVFLVDIMNPCWIYPAADLGHGATLVADVGQVPFNFQIGKDREKIVLHPPATPDGELEVRVDGCEGERIAVLPLSPAVANPAVTRLPPVTLAPRAGRHDLCFTFTSRSLEPTWTIDSLDLERQR